VSRYHQYESSIHTFILDPATLQSMAEAFDQQLDWVVPNDMQISDQTNRTDMGRMIRELYTSGEPFADHLGDTVRVSPFRYRRLI
jgi:hypothetical protein